MTILADVERWLEATGTPPSRIGREACGDPGLLRQLRGGRQVRGAIERRLRSVMMAHPGGLGGAARGRPYAAAGADAGPEMTPCAVERDPCFRCGVRADRHDVLGCRAYRAAG